MDAIATAIANYLPQIKSPDQRRWRGIKEAVDRARASNVSEGVSGDSVRIGIEDLQAVDMSDEVMGAASGEGNGDKDETGANVEVSSPVRRSSRRSKKAEKVLLASEGGTDEDGDEEEVDEEDDDNVSRDGGKDDSKAPREKKKSAYLSYDPAVHSLWTKAVCSLYV